MSAARRGTRRSRWGKGIYLLEVPTGWGWAAGRLGAKWHPELLSWYVETPDHRVLSIWPERLPDPLPGEDRTFGGNELFVDILPTSCWFTDIWKCTDPIDWYRIDALVKRRANSTCETCGTASLADHIHERWEYDEATHTQRLRRLILLCEACHTATHAERSNLSSQFDKAIPQLVTVRRCTLEEARHHVEAVSDLSRKQRETEWALDLKILSSAGIRVVRPDPPVSALKQPLASYAHDSGHPPLSPDLAPRKSGARRFAAESGQQSLPACDAPTGETKASAVTVDSQRDPEELRAFERFITEAVVRGRIPTRPGGPRGPKWPTPQIF